MKLIKLISGLILIFLPLGLASAADNFPKQAVSVITKCYDNASIKDEQVSNCVQAEIKKIPNTLDYNIRLIATEPDSAGIIKVKIVMISKTGLIIYCLGTGDKVKLSVNACVSDKGAPLTPSQQLSIDALF
jgi:hypothetical protein